MSEVWDKKRYHKYNDGLDFNELTDKFIEKFNPKQGASYLEIGFGDAKFIKALHAKRPDIKMYGTEVSSYSLKLAKGLKWLSVLDDNEGFYVIGDKNSMDFISVFYVIDYYCNNENTIDLMLRSYRELLKSDGLLIVTNLTQPTSDIGGGLIHRNDEFVFLFRPEKWFELVGRYFKIVEYKVSKDNVVYLVATIL